MASSLQSLARRGLIKPPPFVVSNLHYEVLMGSAAYGVATATSDCDLYGFAIPPKDVLFPHLAGVLRGFGDQGPVFEQYQQHYYDHPRLTELYPGWRARPVAVARGLDNPGRRDSGGVSRAPEILLVNGPEVSVT